MANGNPNYLMGQHHADLRAIYHRLDQIHQDIKELQEAQKHDLRRVEENLEARIRPLERFKSGCTYVGGVFAGLGSIVVAYVKSKGGF